MIPAVSARVMHWLIRRSQLHIYVRGHPELTADAERVAATVESFLGTGLTVEGSQP
jgi:hypothetical protein